jgi:hypothetical protein
VGAQKNKQPTTTATAEAKTTATHPAFYAAL